MFLKEKKYKEKIKYKFAELSLDFPDLDIICQILHINEDFGLVMLHFLYHCHLLCNYIAAFD